MLMNRSFMIVKVSGTHNADKSRGLYTSLNRQCVHVSVCVALLVDLPDCKILVVSRTAADTMVKCLYSG